MSKRKARRERHRVNALRRKKMKSENEAFGMNSIIDKCIEWGEEKNRIDLLLHQYACIKGRVSSIGGLRWRHVVDKALRAGESARIRRNKILFRKF